MRLVSEMEEMKLKFELVDQKENNCCRLGAQKKKVTFTHGKNKEVSESQLKVKIARSKYSLKQI